MVHRAIADEPANADLRCSSEELALAGTRSRPRVRPSGHCKEHHAEGERVGEKGVHGPWGCPWGWRHAPHFTQARTPHSDNANTTCARNVSPMFCTQVGQSAPAQRKTLRTAIATVRVSEGGQVRQKSSQIGPSASNVRPIITLPSRSTSSNVGLLKVPILCQGWSSLCHSSSAPVFRVVVVEFVV